MIFHSQSRTEHTLGEKRTAMQNNFTFHERNAFLMSFFTYFYNKLIRRLKMKQMTIR